MRRKISTDEWVHVAGARLLYYDNFWHQNNQGSRKLKKLIVCVWFQWYILICGCILMRFDLQLDLHLQAYIGAKPDLKYIDTKSTSLA